MFWRTLTSASLKLFEDIDFMNPNQQQLPTMPQQQMPQQGFNPQHNQMYENLRNVLMQLHQSGMPGIDKVLNTLNQQHVSQMKPPTMPNQPNPLLQMAAGAQNMVQNPPKANFAQQIPPVLAQMMGNAPQNAQNLINTPANSMQSAGKLGADLRTPGTSPMQYSQDAMGAAQLPLLIAALGAMGGGGAGEQAASALNPQTIMQKAQTMGMEALSPQEKQVLQSMPLADLQQLHTGIPQSVEKAMTAKAIDAGSTPPTMPQIKNIGQVQSDLLKQLSEGSYPQNFQNAIYNAMTNVKL